MKELAAKVGEVDEIIIELFSDRFFNYFTEKPPFEIFQFMTLSESA